MPEVIIKAKTNWHPSDTRPESPRKSASLSPKQQLTLAIGQKLPDFIVEAFNMILGEELKPGEIVYDFMKYNDLCSVNQPDIGITLTPKWTEKREAEMESLRDRIRYRLSEFITHNRQIAVGSPDFPQIDIMIKFVIECGVAIDKQGEITSTW